MSKRVQNGFKIDFEIAALIVRRSEYFLEGTLCSYGVLLARLFVMRPFIFSANGKFFHDLQLYKASLRNRSRIAFQLLDD